jgi:hypothetical protein
MDLDLMAFCGAYCGVCEWKAKTNCPGCQVSNGKMFWGDCAVAKCAIAKRLEHCGLCAELPCETLQRLFNDPEHGDCGERLVNLNAWANGEETFLRPRPLKSNEG